ncbi:hypothetical protein RJ639_044007 [Escallonia herrerae]|uniref:Uncharacterized protein n=1 Tax=Escallonia herrerae TaxID=1293975 RepID=A0AA88W9V8_9ASTE|nr:hypothetical protein RJ639_044007 [Escallonia herrerae]
MGTEPAMKPWEQHSAVISIPRFDYNAPTSLLQHSYSEREKSATKEAMSILEKIEWRKLYGVVSSDSDLSEREGKISSHLVGTGPKKGDSSLEESSSMEDMDLFMTKTSMLVKTSPVQSESNSKIELISEHIYEAEPIESSPNLFGRTIQANKPTLTMPLQYIGSSGNCKSQRMIRFNENVATKRSKICIEEAEVHKVVASKVLRLYDFIMLKHFGISYQK